MRPLSYVVILCLLIFTGAVLTSAQPVQSGGEPVLFNGVPAPEKYLAPPQEFLDIGKDSETGPSENPMLAPQVNAERLDPPGLQRSPDPESGMEDLMEKLSEGQENRKDPPGTDQADIIPFPDIMPYPEPETQDAKSLVSSPQDEIARLPPEYQAMGRACLQKGSFNCCMSSVRDMADGGYQMADLIKYKNGCPDGFQRNMLKCVDSFQWCEPVQGEE